jgi:transcriptional regulator with XRE-family HTH domain
LRRLLLDVLDEASTRGVVVGIGDRIKQARVEAGLTQDELGDFVGVGMRQIQYYESGESDPYRKLRQIAEATGKPISWLLRGEDQPDEDEIVERLLVVEALLRDVLRRLPEVPGEPEAGSSDLAG